jgi:putative holliday junction resolvase
MRILALDLGTKSCGIALSDKSNMISLPKEPIFFDKEDYDKLLEKLLPIINEYAITDVVVGLPKNMDGSLGFAANRSLNFAEKVRDLGLKVAFVDERLTTVEAMNVLHFTGKTAKNTKKVIDSVSASIILETYLKGLKYDK